MTKLVDAQAMLEAAASGDLALLTRELERGVPLFSQDLTGNNALFMTLYQGQEDLALVLIGRMTEADPSLAWLNQAARSNGLNVMHVAVTNRKLRALSALLAIQKTPVEGLAHVSAKGNEETPVHLAAREEAIKALQVLLRACPEAIELPDGSQEHTPLGTAIEADKQEAASFLLKEGADPLLVEKTKRPAWAFVQSVAMANLLAEQVEWSSVRDAGGGSILHVLVARGKEVRLSLLKSMLNRPGCQGLVSALDAQKKTPLHVALSANVHPETVEVLVSKGARWSTQDSEGVSALEVLERQLAGGWQLDEEVARMWRAHAKQQRMEEIYPPVTTEKHAPRL